MLHDHKSHAALRRHMVQQFFQGIETAGGATNADNRESSARDRGYLGVWSGLRGLECDSTGTTSGH